MYNCKSHKRNLSMNIRFNKINILFQSPYSPEINMIENIQGYLKQKLR